jgi:rfaE bifunctional protein kinase chain/domain
MSDDTDRLRALVPALAGRRVVVLGDVILDEYVVGRPTRVSREAPVLVLEFARRFWRPGGAGNPAFNIQALGSRADLVSTLGDDAAGRTLADELARAGLASAGVVVRSDSTTAAKTRLLAEDSSSRQHIARLDYAAPWPDGSTRAAMTENLRAAAEGADALLLSDYKGGVVDATMVELARELGRERGILTTADSQGDLALFAGLDLVKCNQVEAEAALGRHLEAPSDVDRAGRDLLELLGARYVVLTRGPAGLSAFERDRSATHLPAANRTEVFDVTGAGDTVIAVLTLALVAGASLAEAAQLANLAAGLVVRRLGVATVSPADLQAAIDTLGRSG